MASWAAAATTTGDRAGGEGRHCTFFFFQKQNRVTTRGETTCRQQCRAADEDKQQNAHRTKICMNRSSRYSIRAWPWWSPTTSRVCKPVICRCCSAPDQGPSGTLYGHFARANPQWKALANGAEALVIFAGRYVSPGFYPSKAEHGKVVPTWNYVAVHAYGTAEVFI